MRNLAFLRRQREDRQSWYLLALVTPWTFWMTLVYTGVRARQIVAMRKLLGKYQSFEHFAQRNSLDPELREKWRPMVLNSEPAGQSVGRIVEAGESKSTESVAEAKAGRARIVDL